MVGHHPYGVADGTCSPRLNGAFVAPQAVLDLDSLGEWIHPGLVELVVAADPSRDELDLDVVRTQLAQPDQRADMDLRTDLDRIRVERLDVIDGYPGPRRPDSLLPLRDCLGASRRPIDRVHRGGRWHVEVRHVVADH